uniref:Uncharacterized protein n=1 Tax=Rhizophora mucronata TaxID=61149 RepID=A0A2P2Q910_RHIMU
MIPESVQPQQLLFKPGSNSQISPSTLFD